jgi:hypothetical protein
VLDRPTEQDVGKANLKLQAANIFLESRIGDHQAALLVGTPRELEEARLSAVAAMESMLDAKAFLHSLIKRFNGLEGENA